ncbi:DUF5693 family protein [Paucisalibacillus globulus]|uniref:DUF5693 family protein n=1 Tax=Paucisalibacillus globulus TaxID=351095 RepID=UPI000420E7B0|nr:DUF5693 family protein [Paucisalibacillus globulus]
MKYQKYFWLILILLLLASSPGIINRWHVETSNNKYEIIAPYEEIHELTLDGNITIEHAFNKLKEAGLTTISLSPLSLFDLERLNILSIFEQQELAKAAQFTNTTEEFITPGYYLTVPSDPYYQELIVQSLNPEIQTIGEQQFYFLKVEDGINRSTVVGYDELTMEQIKSHGLSYILRAENTMNQEANHGVVKALIDQDNSPNRGLLFIGPEVLGYPNVDLIKNWASELNQSGYTFYSIEFDHQQGMQSIARLTDYNTVRLHSIFLDNKDLNENINQAIRAIKERNIRSVLFHFQTSDSKSSLENAISFISGINQEIPSHFTAGVPKPFKEIQVSHWIIILLLLAGVIFTYLASQVYRNKWVSFSSGIGMLLIALAYLLLDRLVLLQGFALIIAIVTPIYAILSTTVSNQKIIIQYLKALGITFVGIVIIIGLLNGNPFITGFEVFRGVKLVYLIPIPFTGLFLFYREGLLLLNKEVKYWHLLLFLIVGAIGIYYISRTGNTGEVSNMELLLRNKLEEILYVRPRTKEVLIGFPFYLLGLYLLRRHQLVGKLFVLIGVIGFLSIVNTFTHFHIPLYISLLRTVYSIVLGYLMGMLFIYLYKQLFPKVSKVIKKRWI